MRNFGGTVFVNLFVIFTVICIDWRTNAQNIGRAGRKHANRNLGLRDGEVFDEDYGVPQHRVPNQRRGRHRQGPRQGKKFLR